MDYNKVLQLAKKYFPDASDGEIKEGYDAIMKASPNITFEEFEQALPIAAPRIQQMRDNSVQDRENKMEALKYMRG